MYHRETDGKWKLKSEIWNLKIYNLEISFQILDFRFQIPEPTYEWAAARSFPGIAISSGCAAMCACTIASARAIVSGSPFR